MVVVVGTFGGYVGMESAMVFLLLLVYQLSDGP
jgi:hypothetical protein